MSTQIMVLVALAAGYLALLWHCREVATRPPLPPALPKQRRPTRDWSAALKPLSPWEQTCVSILGFLVLWSFIGPSSHHKDDCDY